MTSTAPPAARFHFRLGKLFLLVALVAIGCGTQKYFRLDVLDSVFFGAWYGVTIASTSLTRSRGWRGILVTALSAGVVCMVIDLWMLSMPPWPMTFFERAAPVIVLTALGASLAGLLAAMVYVLRGVTRRGVTIAAVATAIVGGGVWIDRLLHWRELSQWHAHASVAYPQFSAGPTLLFTMGYADDSGKKADTGEGRQIKIWQVPTGRYVGAVDLSGVVSDFVVSPDARLLAVTDHMSHLSIYRVDDGARIAELTDLRPACMAFTEDSAQLIVVEVKPALTTVGTWNASDWTLPPASIKDLPVSGQMMFALSPDGNSLAAQEWSNPLKVWRRSKKESGRSAAANDFEIPLVRYNYRSKGKLLFSTDSQCLFSSDELWNLRTEKVIPLPITPIQVVGASGPLVACETSTWDLSGERRVLFRGHPLARLFSQYRFNRLAIWRMGAKTAETESRMLSEIDFTTISPDGRYLATSTDGEVRLWEIPAERPSR